MQKILSILIIICLPCILFAQAEKQAQDKIQKKDTAAKIIGAKVLKVGKPEIYKNARQNYLRNMDEISVERRKTNCNDSAIMQERKVIMDNYKKSDDNEYKKIAITMIGHSNCPENMRFLEQVILTDTCMQLRISSIQYLNGGESKSSIPLLIKYSKKPLSIKEGATLAGALVGLGEKKHSLELLQKYCSPANVENCSACEYAYYTLGGNIAKAYFKQVLLTTDDPTIRCRYAQRLAELGDVETSLPILLEFLKSEEPTKRGGALFGLAAIGTQECYDIIADKEINDPDSTVRYDAGFILKKSHVEAEVIEVKENKETKRTKQYKFDYEK